MKKSSELKIIFSNCLAGGTAWNSIGSELIQNLYAEMVNINNLEFKKINSNTVRGEHNSFTLVLVGVFYNLTMKQNRDDMSNLLEYLRNAANKISSFTYSEIRIEHTRNFSTWDVRQ
jgi:hypothetical protein